MKKVITGIMFILMFLTLAACQSNKLSGEASSFAAKGGSYAFRLPEGWEVEQEYQTIFNKAAVFGAIDTNSLSQMFIRTELYDESINEEKLKQLAKDQLEKYHDELTAEPEEFQVDGFSGIYYKGEDLFKRKPVWIHLYYVAVGKQIVEFQFQSPKDQSDKGRQEVFRKAVQSLKVKANDDKVAVSESEQEQEQTPRKAENDQLSLQITGQKVEKQDSGKGVLILRYICTNKGEQSIVPVDEWDKAVTVEQGTAVLASLAESQEEEVNYLLQAGGQSLGASKTIEAAVVYTLEDATDNVRLIFDNELFPEKEALELEITN
ncbi:DUF5067 domain-containing protein [Candidatus Enterococcus clewellii]|uniref:DUF5067 domain-containing protein n=1 Tax=Candidatus Enterococcus clewellii TaxID=1834193 RepID=A0A242K922_9ENTE|nr:DUF5067 domain-containing protein [Enterococcus sp. 9E7_DIV0242]OTP17674.1 hypothetical protein A5888_001812 [Enterococcus sp. 9E7_DIV0242]